MPEADSRKSSWPCGVSGEGCCVVGEAETSTPTGTAPRHLTGEFPALVMGVAPSLRRAGRLPERDTAGNLVSGRR